MPLDLFQDSHRGKLKYHSHLGKKNKFLERTSATSLQPGACSCQPRCWAWMAVGSASGSEIVGREPMFTATDSASVGIWSVSMQFPLVPLSHQEKFLWLLSDQGSWRCFADFEVSQAWAAAGWATCIRLLLGVWLVGFEGALAGRVRHQV